MKGRDAVIVCSDYVQAAQPTGEPTVPGWYWVRAYDETVTAKISELDIQTGVFAFNGKHTYGARCRFDGAKFSGPIPPPEGWGELC